MKAVSNRTASGMVSVCEAFIRLTDKATDIRTVNENRKARIILKQLKKI